MFRSENEIYNFDFADAKIEQFKIDGANVIITLEALIIEPENSQNENYTKSYAGLTKAKFENAEIISGIKDGYKRYDANNKLVEDVEDTPIDKDELLMILKNSKGAYLYAMDANDNSSENLFSYTVSIEFANMNYDTTVTKSYQFIMTFKRALFEWDKYMNKVMQ